MILRGGLTRIAPRLWQWEVLVFGRHALTVWRQGRRAGISVEIGRFPRRQ